MALRRSKRRYGRTAKDIRRGGLGTRTPYVPPLIKNIELWLRKNGVNVDDSKTVQTVSATGIREIVTISQTIELSTGDYVELMFAVNDLIIGLNSIAADGISPLAPSVHIDIKQVR